MDNYNKKYEVEYTNILNDSFKLEIFKMSEYTFSIKQLTGVVDLIKSKAGDVFDPIRATSLNIRLDASQDDLLSDFSGFNEFDFKVKFYRNDEQIFEGWINPDGWFQNWVDDRWIISMTAVDGLGTLKNLEFTDIDEVTALGTTLEFKYKPREFNYLHRILRFLGYELPYVIADDINIDLGVATDWVDFKKRIIDLKVFENKNGNFLDSEKVLKDILQKYNLFITQENIGNRLVWYIGRVMFANYPDQAKRGRQYNITYNTDEGSAAVEVQLNQFAFIEPFPQKKTIISDIHSDTLKHHAIHCNENQQITYNPALQNFRFQSDWLGTRDFLDTMASWSEIPPMPSGFFLTPDYMRMYSVLVNDIVNDPWFESIEVRQPSNQNDGIILTVDWYIDYLFMNPAVVVPSETRLRFLLEAYDGTNTFYYNLTNQAWQSAVELFEIKMAFPSGLNTIGVVEGKTDVFVKPLNNATYKLLVYSPISATTDLQHEVRINNVLLTFDVSQFGIGKTHDATQPEKRSTFLDTPVNIINSNEPNAFFTNNLYRIASPPEIITGLVPMNKWKANDTPNYSDLLELTSRERIRAKAKPQMVFRGDVFGFIPYVSIVNYNGINGNFVPTEYNYQTAEGIIQLECTQIFNDNVSIDHEKSYIFENETNVLIKEL